MKRTIAVFTLFLALAGGALAGDPKADGKFMDARAAYGSADYSRAVSLCDEVLKLDPKHAAAHALRGKAKKDLGDIDAATADLNKAIALDANLGEAYYIRGQVSEIMGEMKKAQADYASACKAGFKEACK